MEIKYKQYVFLPKSLGMSVGKASSQVAHATFMALEKQRFPSGLQGADERRIQFKLIEDWKQKGMCVIVLEVDDPEHLSNVAAYLSQWDIPHHLYYDEGITEVPPMTPTALATGVLTEDQFWMFEQFNLFGKKVDAQEIVDVIENNSTIADKMEKLRNDSKFVSAKEYKYCFGS